MLLQPLRVCPRRPSFSPFLFAWHWFSVVGLVFVPALLAFSRHEVSAVLLPDARPAWWPALRQDLCCLTWEAVKHLLFGLHMVLVLLGHRDVEFVLWRTAVLLRVSGSA